MASPSPLLLSFLLILLISTTYGDPSAMSAPPLASMIGWDSASSPSMIGWDPASSPSMIGWAPAPSPGWAPSPAQMPNHLEHLPAILASLGYQKLAVASNALSGDLSDYGGPVTVFAPSDSSVLTCTPPACVPLRLLREHMIPGHFSLADLADLPFGAKLETSAPDRCLTVTSTTGNVSVASLSPTSATTASASPVPRSKIFLDGVELMHPDLYDDGKIVIHGLQGFVSALSPLSCVPGPLDPAFLPQGPDPSVLTRLMLRDAMLRLHHGGYSILSLAIRVKFLELAELNNMTIFALDDPAIFAGAVSYVTSVRFHVVPDRLLVHADLVRLPEGTVLPTLIAGQRLVVTNSGAAGARVRVNFVPVKVPDVIYNGKVAVHGIFMPFPHLYLTDHSAATVPDEGGLFDGRAACSGSGCAATASASPAPSVSVEDGL